MKKLKTVLFYSFFIAGLGILPLSFSYRLSHITRPLDEKHELNGWWIEKNIFQYGSEEAFKSLMCLRGKDDVCPNP